MNTWWRRLRKRLEVLHELRAPGEIWLLIRMIGFAALVPIQMRRSLASLEAFLEPRRATPAADPRRIARLVDLALHVGQPLVGGGCLTRGLTRYYYLRRAGLDVSLAFGVGHADGAVAGHCWLVSNDEPFLESRDPRVLFTEVHRIPTRPLSAGVA